MTREERFDKILMDLMEFDEIFADFGRMGRCIFVDDPNIPTACIAYNSQGDEMGFYWNPNFFDSCSDYKNAFILCHEMLHIFLKHGKRGMGLDPDRSNITMDISINHMLVDAFGFQRPLIEGWENLCWRDTVYNIKIPPMPSFEGYYNVEDQYFISGFTSLDVHTFLPLADEDEDKGILLPEVFLDKIAETLARIPSQSSEEGDFTEKIVVPNRKKKPKWEIIVRNAIKSVVEKKKVFGDTWASINRRLCDVCPDLPVNKRIEDRPNKAKYLCHFYIDNSGSCCDYIERFANCANSLDEKVFDAKVFTFDTRVYEIKKENGAYVVRGGGGTVFQCVVNHVESAEREPDVIFVLTDGYAEPVFTKKPKKWNWLITECGSIQCLKQAGKTWPLSQFE